MAKTRRPGAGRPADWLRTECENIIKKNKLIEFLGEVAIGEPIQKVKSPTGQVTELKVSADIKDRLKAIEMLSDRAYGKPTQAVEVTGDVSLNLIEAVKQARAQRGKA